MRTLIRVSSLGALALLLALSLDRPVLGQAADLPNASTIIGKHVEAIGGEKAWSALKSIRATGTFEVAGTGMTGNVEILTARPAKTREHLEVAGIGAIDDGFDGTVGWNIDPMSGPSIARDRVLQQMKDDAEFDAVLHKPAFVKSMTTVEKTDFDGHAAYKLKVVLVSGIERLEYFDVQTGLQIGMEDDHETSMGTAHQVTTLRDYRKFGAILQPTLVSSTVMGQDQVIHVASYEYDTVPPDAFALPPQIRALIK